MMEKLKTHEGIIEITKIENSGDNAATIGTLTARFVRYPGCQQLSVWLPEYGGSGYGKLRIVDIKTQTVIEEQAVSHKINGSILMTWDTLEWVPSEYRLDIEHPKGGYHTLYFNKLEENDVIPKDKIVEMPVAKAENPSLVNSLLPKNEPESSENDSKWNVYTDGLGNPIPNEDRMIRDRAFEDLTAKFSRHIEFEGTYRSGYVTYIEGDIRIRFLHEMYGGKYKFGIEIPSENQWETQTKTPLSRRQEIIEFLAETVKSEQASSWQYEIRETDIAYF
jgi:hypothetical protein